MTLSTEGSLCVCVEVGWLPAPQPTGSYPPTEEHGGTTLSSAHRPVPGTAHPVSLHRPSLLGRHGPHATVQRVTI